MNKDLRLWASVIVLTLLAAFICGCIDTARVTHPHNYTTVYANEKWYKDEPTKEQTYFGHAYAVKPDGNGTVLMRTHYYEISIGAHNYSVYAQKGDLDPYLNRTNDWVGKIVTFELEGSNITEFWPGKVRSDMDF